MPAADGSCHGPGGGTDDGEHDATREPKPNRGPDGLQSMLYFNSSPVYGSQARSSASTAEVTETPSPRTRNTLIQVQMSGGAQKSHEFETYDPSLIPYFDSTGMDRADPSARLEQREQALRTPSEEVAAREIQRKLRNREAATRSNARRKERNAALRNGLAKAIQQASELRERDKNVRAENIAMRKQLGHAMLPGRKESDQGG
jgi:hypothetical protein